MPIPGLQLDAVSAGYRRGTPVVYGVSGTWHPGELTALLGPNGAGKSTLLRAALGQGDGGDTGEGE